jgi:glycine dehydrogenase subunit 1
MLATIGVARFDDLIGALPKDLVRPKLNLPGSMSEMELLRHMEELASRDHLAQSYLGAGAYEHFVPTAVWSVALARRIRHRLHALPGGGQSRNASIHF